MSITSCLDTFGNSCNRHIPPPQFVLLPGNVSFCKNCEWMNTPTWPRNQIALAEHGHMPFKNGLSPQTPVLKLEWVLVSFGVYIFNIRKYFVLLSASECRYSDTTSLYLWKKHSVSTVLMGTERYLSAIDASTGVRTFMLIQTLTTLKCLGDGLSSLDKNGARSQSHSFSSWADFR